VLDERRSCVSHVITVNRLNTVARFSLTAKLSDQSNLYSLTPKTANECTAVSQPLLPVQCPAALVTSTLPAVHESDQHGIGSNARSAVG